MAWQSSLALQVEADDACTAMRLGERMENHVWGISGNFYTARNATGTVLYSKARDSRNKQILYYELKINTNRKAKYKPIFIRYCIGFFCLIGKFFHKKNQRKKPKSYLRRTFWLRRHYKK